LLQPRRPVTRRSYCVRSHCTLRWHAGMLSELDVRLPRSRPATVYTDEDMVAFVHRLAVPCCYRRHPQSPRPHHRPRSALHCEPRGQLASPARSAPRKGALESPRWPRPAHRGVIGLDVDRVAQAAEPCGLPSMASTTARGCVTRTSSGARAAAVAGHHHRPRGVRQAKALEAGLGRGVSVVMACRPPHACHGAPR
jgi:hypothetical protein